MQRYPEHSERRRVTLDGSWRFAWLGDADIDSLDPADLEANDIAAVPGCFDTAGELIGQRGVALYRARVDFPPGPARLVFGGLGLYARVFVDGREAGVCRTPYSTLGYDLELAGDEHLVEVLLDNRYDDENRVPLFRPNYDFYGYGGIYRSVTLESRPALGVERVKVDTLDPKRGRVRLEIRLGGHARRRPRELKFSYRFDRGAFAEKTLPVENDRVVFETRVPNARVWSPDSPELHTVTVDIDGDRCVERFGLRTITTRGRDLLLNGKPLRLLGVNRHEAHPNFGPVQPLQLMVDDIRWLKELGANFVRGAHYQLNPEFLECCDEAGLLVWHESLAWGLKESSLKRPGVVRALEQSTRAMARESLNHPCVALRAFANECASDTPVGRRVYEKLVRVLRDEDPVGLVSFASSRFEEDICLDLVDVISFNPYPGWITHLDPDGSDYSKNIRSRIDELARNFSKGPCADKPMLISEAGACGVWGRRDRARAQWSEEFQADYFEHVIRAVLDNPRYVGITLWQMLDCRSFVNTGPIRNKPFGYNLAGLLDEYRRPKLSFDAVKDLYRRALN